MNERAKYLEARRSVVLEYAEAFEGVPHVLPWWIDDPILIKMRTRLGLPWTKEDEDAVMEMELLYKGIEQGNLTTAGVPADYTGKSILERARELTLKEGGV